MICFCSSTLACPKNYEREYLNDKKNQRKLRVLSTRSLIRIPLIKTKPDIVIPCRDRADLGVCQNGLITFVRAVWFNVTVLLSAVRGWPDILGLQFQLDEHRRCNTGMFLRGMPVTRCRNFEDRSLWR